jgi:ABC-2 type transport system ATP-binding protein
MIEANGLVKRYGAYTAIEDISFSVEQGEIVGFLGPNGAGKTTTMRILTGYLPPSEGSASIAGHDIFSDSLAARRNLGYLPENVPLYPEMTVVDYLDYMARLRRLPQRRDAVEKAMELVHVTDRADDRIAKLSKGYRQRVGLAQALLHDPPVLILDEPTVGLDPRQISEVRELIRTLGSERTIILSTHILPEVSQLCNRIIIMSDGRIAAIDTPQGLTNSLQRATRVYLQLGQPAPDTAEQLQALDGIEHVQEQSNGRFELTSSHDSDLRPALAAMVVERGWDLLELRAVSLSMEEIFLELTTHEHEHEEDEDNTTAASKPDEPAGEPANEEKEESEPEEQAEKAER